jgi:hypothetical protein
MELLYLLCNSTSAAVEPKMVLKQGNGKTGLQITVVSSV